VGNCGHCRDLLHILPEEKNLALLADKQQLRDLLSTCCASNKYSTVAKSMAIYRHTIKIVLKVVASTSEYPKFTVVV
jgi:DNA invertase Pin-like site-specific DNA recombinase